MCPFIQTIPYFQGNVNNSQNNVKKRLFRIRIGGRQSVLSVDAPPFACAARLCRFSRFRPLIICVFLHICPVRPVLPVARDVSAYAVRRLLVLFVFMRRPLLSVARGESVYAVPHLLALFVFIWRLLLPVVRVVLAYSVRRLFVFFIRSRPVSGRLRINQFDCFMPALTVPVPFLLIPCLCR